MITLRRAQIRRGVVGVDVTVKSAKGWARAFAPTWAMVLGHKRGTMTSAEYTRRYAEILGCVPAEVWERLRQSADEEGVLTLLCYCQDGKFCHTHLIIEWVIARWPDQYQR